MAAICASSESERFLSCGLPVRQRQIFHRRARKIGKQQTLVAQTDFLQDRPDIVHAPRASPASFDVVAIVILAGDDRHHAGTGFKCLQNMFRLKPSRAWNDDLLDVAGQVQSPGQRAEPALAEVVSLRGRAQLAHTNTVTTAVSGIVSTSCTSIISLTDRFRLDPPGRLQQERRKCC